MITRAEKQLNNKQRRDEQSRKELVQMLTRKLIGGSDTLLYDYLEEAYRAAMK